MKSIVSKYLKSLIVTFLGNFQNLPHGYTRQSAQGSWSAKGADMRKTEKKSYFNDSNFELAILVTLQNPFPHSPNSEYFGMPLIKGLRVNFSILVWSIDWNQILESQ